MKRSIGAMIGLLVLFLAAVGIANAAALNLTAPKLSTASAADRCAATVQVDVPPGMITAGSTKSVVLSGLNAKCAKKNVSLTLYSTQGAAVSTVKSKKIGTITSGKATVIVPTANVANVEGAALTIGTWGIPTTFTKPLPLLSCTIDGRPDVACSVTYESPDPGTGRFLLNNVLISTDPVVAEATFKLTINLADPSLPQPIREIRSTLKLAPGMVCSSRPVVDLVGPSWGNETNLSGETFEFFIAGSIGTLDPPPQNPILQCP